MKRNCIKFLPRYGRNCRNKRVTGRDYCLMHVDELQEEEEVVCEQIKEEEEEVVVCEQIKEEEEEVVCDSNVRAGKELTHDDESLKENIHDKCMHTVKRYTRLCNNVRHNRTLYCKIHASNKGDDMINKDDKNKKKKEKKDDEWMTSKETWEEIYNFLPKDKIIWEAFFGDGNSGKFLGELGCMVLQGDIDFFDNYKLVENKFDVIVSNIPFSIKFEVLQKLRDIDKPFIILMPASVIFTKKFNDIFKEKGPNGIQIVSPTKRIQYIRNGEVLPFCSFESCYYFYKWNLASDIIKLDEWEKGARGS